MSDQLGLFGDDAPTPPRQVRERRRTRVELWQQQGVELRSFDGHLWPVEGDVGNKNGRPYCLVCKTFYCPHAKPGLYEMRAIPSSPVAPDDPWWLRLDGEQLQEAMEETKEREGRAVRSRAKARVYDPGREVSFEQTLRACKGEKAISLLLGLPWTGKIREGGMGRADVGDFYEVRSVEVPWKGLIFRPGKDKPNFPFILTLVDEDLVTALGWEWGGEIAVERNLQPPSRMSNKTWWLLKPGELQAMPQLPRRPE